MIKKILIVDDEQDFRDIMADELTESGYTPVRACNGKEALAKMEEESPDLVLLDVIMPVMDGFEFFKTVKKDPAKANVPVIVLTARQAMIDTFRVMGADDFMAKPFDSDKLLAKIAFLLKDKAVLLSSDPFVIEKVSESFAKIGYDTYIVKDMDELLDKGSSTKYKAVVIHLPSLDRSPEDLVPAVNTMNYRNPKVIAYCDTTVKGLEDFDTSAVEELRMRWERAGVSYFYDKRISEELFSELLRDWMRQ